MAHYASGSPKAASHTPEAGKAIQNPLQALATQGSIAGNPLALIQQKKSEITATPAQRREPFPGTNPAAVKAGQNGWETAMPNMTAGSTKTPVQRIWEEHSQQGILINKEYLASDGITWYYDTATDKMDFTVERRSPHYKKLKAVADDTKLTYDDWLRFWRMKGWLPAIDGESYDDIADIEDGGGDSGSGGDESDSGGEDDEALAEREPVVEKPQNFNRTHIPKDSPYGTVGMNDFLTVTDDTILTSSGFGGCSAFLVIGPGRSRTLAHVTASILTDATEQAHNTALIDGIKAAVAGARLVVITDAASFRKGDNGMGDRIIRVFGLTRVPAVVFQEMVRSVQILAQGQIVLEIPERAPRGGGGASASGIDL